MTQSGAAKICPGETRTYAISAVADAVSYYWKVPAGATLLSGQGDTAVTISFDDSYAVSDTISVRAENSCGNSAYRIKIVTKGSAPAKPSVITGDYYGVCGASGKPYSIIDVPGLTYAWSFSNGDASVASGQGTSSIIANFAPAYLTGALNVTGTNGCGTSPVRTRTINAIPTKPESITGDAVVCAHETGVPYSTPVISGAATYTWKAPTGAHVSDGVTTSPLNTLTTTANSVTVNFGTASGDVRVKATNACGYTGNFILPVTVGCGGGRLAGNTVASETTADVVVYPNPASDQVSISFQSKQGTSYSISLYDVLGKEVMVEEGSVEEGTNQVELNTTSLASGVYHLVLKGDGLDYNTKLVLDK